MNNVIILFYKEYPTKKIKEMSDEVITLPPILSGTAKKLFRRLAFATSKH